MTNKATVTDLCIIICALSISYTLSAMQELERSLYRCIYCPVVIVSIAPQLFICNPHL